MIKKITLKNFESHEDSTIEFSEGLNLIIGQSNQGKSSIVRGLSLVVANRFDKDEVRTGAAFCSVTVETEKGSVTAERGEDVNHWIVETTKEKKEYRNIGTTVPPGVLEILGMSERIHGEIKELPNIMFQLEKHYMLSEIDGKKTTSNAIARMMDEAIGIGGMEELIKDIATDFASKKKDLGTKNIQVSELHGKILDIAIFESYKKSLELARESLVEAESLKELLDSAHVLSSRLEENKFALDRVCADIAVSDGLKELSEGLRDSIGKLVLFRKASQNLLDKEKINSQLSLSEEIESLYDSLLCDIKKYQLLKNAQRVKLKFDMLSDKIPQNVSFEIEKTKIQESYDSIEKANNLLSEARNLYKKIRNISNRFISEERELKSAESRFEELKTQLGTCPLCGGAL